MKGVTMRRTRTAVRQVLLPTLLLTAASSVLRAEEPDWPTVTSEMKPRVYNYWPDSAVDEKGIEAQCEQLAAAGFGGFHIIPIYGVKGNEANARPYGSARWLEALAFSKKCADRHGLAMDLTSGTGWNFGGPCIRPEDGGMRFAVREGKLVVEPTGMKVKRAAVGGEGLMLNPFSPRAMDAFLAHLEELFGKSDAVRPNRMYHDSYEYYGASWSPELSAAFKARRGYALEDHAEEMVGRGDSNTIARIKCDYRETLSDLMIEDVFPRWVNWCHGKGIETRNEGHGAPANWLDYYALADVPETEIMKGPQCAKRPHVPLEGPYADAARPIAVSKFASSAAHLAGKRFVSAESCTWICEHFMESFASIKCFLDRLFLSGVTQVYYHSMCYTPIGEDWPGWCYYASCEMNPRNPIWRNVPTLNAYVTRCQSFFQTARPDNDVLVYWPLHDYWTQAEGFELQMSVFKNESWFFSRPIGRLSRQLLENGWSYDYISDRLLARLPDRPGQHKAIVVPECRVLPLSTAKRLMQLAQKGYKVIFENNLPTEAAGYLDNERRTAELTRLLQTAPNNVSTGNVENLLAKSGVRREPFTRERGLLFARYARERDGVYFVVNPYRERVCARFPLPKRTESVFIFDPMDGTHRPASINDDGVLLDLPLGASVFLVTSREKHPAAVEQPPSSVPSPVVLKGPWKLTGVTGGPGEFAPRTLRELTSWSTNPDGTENPFCGTVRYSTSFDSPPNGETVKLDLGKVCDSARVTVNGKDLGTVLMAPYVVSIPAGLLKEKGNRLEVEVTNLGANRIRALDRAGVVWKKFKNINMVSPDYNRLDATDWPLLDSGLLGPVTLFRRIKADDQLVVAERGRPSSYTIVIPTDADKINERAARELSGLIEATVGTTLSIRDDSHDLPSCAILIGPTRFTESVAGKTALEECRGDDASSFSIRTCGRHVVITGHSTALLYGVYELLQRFAGVEWYSDEIADIPNLEYLALPSGLDRRETPTFSIRDTGWRPAKDAATAARLRLNGTHVGHSAYCGWAPIKWHPDFKHCHSFKAFISKAEFGATHPEYFAKDKQAVPRLKGIPKPQLCLTNPDVRRLAKERLLKAVRDRPDIRYFGISQEDNTSWCHCPDCEAINQREGSASGTLVQFLNEIADVLAAERSDARLTTLAYHQTRNPPRTLKLRDNVIVGMCVTECDFSRPIVGHPAEGNRTFLSAIQKWSEISGGLWIWDYTTDYGWYPHAMANLDTIAGNLRLYADNKAFYTFAGGSACPYAYFGDLKAYVLAKLMWNVKQPLQPLIRRFCTAYYGAAAADDIQRIIDLFENYPRDVIASRMGYAEDPTNPAYPDELFETAARLWKAASEKCNGSTLQARNVRRGRFGNDTTRLTRYLLRQAERTDQAEPNDERRAEMLALARELLEIERQREAEAARHPDVKMWTWGWHWLGRQRFKGLVENFVAGKPLLSESRRKAARKAKKRKPSVHTAEEDL